MGADPASSEMDATRELATFLRDRRARLTPEIVGLPARRVGRTPGLRREEVAQLANVSTDYVTRLEQGRGLRPSADVIDALARALRLDADESTYLFGLVGHVPPNRESRSSTATSLAALVDALAPLPAMLVDEHFDIRGWNREMCSLMLDFDDIAPSERNLIRLCVMHPLFRTFYRDRADIMREGVADLRSAWATRPDDPDLARLVAEMNSESAEFAKLWAQRDVRIRGEGAKRLCHATHGPLDVRYNALCPLGDSAWRIYVYRAADESSQQVLNRIIAGGSGHE
jgi:transcriptional regulator with XRE-family HTH domain